MKILPIVTGANITACVDGTPLYGIRGITTDEKTSWHEVCEYLTQETAAVVPARSRFIITLTVDWEQIPDFLSEPDFSLAVSDGGRTITYLRCRCTAVRRTALPSKACTAEIEITAEGSVTA